MIVAHSRVLAMKSLLRLSILIKSSWFFDSRAAREVGGWPPFHVFFNYYIVDSIKGNVKRMFSAGEARTAYEFVVAKPS
jgi:hypothetical protein